MAKHLRNRTGNIKYSLTIRWTAGHSRIPGNEKADREAKHVAAGYGSDRKDLLRYVQSKIKHSISALQQANNKKRNETWKKEWQGSKGYKHFKAKDTALPTLQKYLSLIN